MTAIDSARFAAVKVLQSFLQSVPFRGKGTILSALCPKDGVIDFDLYGYRLECDVSENIQRSMFLYGHDAAVIDLIRANLKPGDTFLDVGANVGFYTLLAASIVGAEGRVIAVEPNPKTFRKLKETLERNRIGNVLLLNVGLAEQQGSLSLFTDPKAGNDSATMVACDAPESVLVEVLPLDLVASMHGIERIHYLKIDVDGFEPKVFAGAGRLLAERKIDFIQSEFCDYWLRQNGSSPGLLHASLLRSGFEDVAGTPDFVPGCIVDRILVRHGVQLQVGE